MTLISYRCNVFGKVAILSVCYCHTERCFASEVPGICHDAIFGTGNHTDTT